MNANRRISWLGLLVAIGWIVLAPSLSQYFRAFAQDAREERTYPQLKTQVEQTLRRMGAYSGGQLPVLDGFVVQENQPLDRYQRPYYQYSIQVLTASSGKTLVRVAAKITAWYSDPDASGSGYRSLSSNGRLESDLFARLEDALKNQSALSGTAPASGTAVDRPSGKVNAPSPELRSSTALPAKPAITSSPRAATPAHAAITANTVPTDADIETLRKQTEALEKRRDELSGTAHDLEEILRSQAHPTDLAVVRKSGTPVLAQPESTARVLFRAEAEDEFEVLDLEKDWIHVQISGASRGWIRRSQLDFPETATSPVATGNGNSSQLADEPFRVTREETVAFAGNWEPLKGKTVRLIWVQPTLQDEKRTGASAKLLFAKEVFLKATSDLAQSPASIAGVVIVFDAADGGQAAAQTSVLERWKSGTLSDSDFWKQVSLDPPETFHTSPKS